MKLSQRTIKHLRKHINGDGEGSEVLKHGQYRSGPKLVDLFVELGSDDTYGPGFPSRWEYTESKINQINHSSEIKVLLETVFDPLEYECSAKEHMDVIDNMNLYLTRDGYRLDLENGSIRVYSNTGNQVSFIPPAEIDLLSNEFISENIAKCDKKLADGDYSGAITNARSLCEEVFSGLEKTLNSNAKKYDGDLPKLFKRLKTLLNMEAEGKPADASILQLLRGITSTINGLAGISNSLGDRHGGSGQKGNRHHAELAINSANTICTYVLASYRKQFIED